MEYSNEYQSRHGLADFESSTFKITNKKDSTTIDCKLIKVPDYSITRTFNESVCEGNGWCSIGNKKTETINYNSYWLVVLNNKCLGVIDTREKKSLSGKFKITQPHIKQHIITFLQTI